MRYLVGSLLCLSTVMGEAIPESLSKLDSTQELFYAMASKSAIQLNANKKASPFIQAVPNKPTSVSSSVSTTTSGAPTSISATSSLMSPTPVRAQPTTLMTQPRAAGSKSGAGSSTISDSPTTVNSAKPAAATTTKITQTFAAKPVGESNFTPKVVTSSDLEIQAAQKRAVKFCIEDNQRFYKKTKGTKEAQAQSLDCVTNKVLTTRDGKRFLLVIAKGDGSCGFYASGITRREVVNAFGMFIKQNPNHYPNPETSLKEIEKMYIDHKKCFEWHEVSGLQPRLKTQINLWMKEKNDSIYSYEKAACPNGKDVRNLVYTPGHFDLLFPIDE